MTEPVPAREIRGLGLFAGPGWPCSAVPLASRPAERTRRADFAHGLQETLQATIDELKVPSTVVLVHSESQGDWTATFGARTIGGERAARRRPAAGLAGERPGGRSRPSGRQYGHHLAKLGPMIGHTGQIPGYSSFMGRDPEQRNTVIVLTSLVDAPDVAVAGG